MSTSSEKLQSIQTKLNALLGDGSPTVVKSNHKPLLQEVKDFLGDLDTGKLAVDPTTWSEEKRVDIRENIEAAKEGDVINDLTTGGDKKPLSAEMGKDLDEKKFNARIKAPNAATLSDFMTWLLLPENYAIQAIYRVFIIDIDKTLYVWHAGSGSALPYQINETSENGVITLDSGDNWILLKNATMDDLGNIHIDLFNPTLQNGMTVTADDGSKTLRIDQTGNIYLNDEIGEVIARGIKMRDNLLFIDSVGNVIATINASQIVMPSINVNEESVTLNPTETLHLISSQQTLIGAGTTLAIGAVSNIGIVSQGGIVQIMGQAVNVPSVPTSDVSLKAANTLFVENKLAATSLSKFLQDSSHMLVTSDDKNRWTEKQNTIIPSLPTNSKSIEGAISETYAIAKQAPQALSSDDYVSFIGDLLSKSEGELLVGQSWYIVQTDVPDLWISQYATSFYEYSINSDSNFIEDIINNGGSLHVGWYFVSFLENQKVDLQNYLKKNGDGSQLIGLTKSQVGLGNVNNTSDADKPVSTAQALAIAGRSPLDHTHPEYVPTGRKINGKELTGDLVLSQSDFKSDEYIARRGITTIIDNLRSSSVVAPCFRQTLNGGTVTYNGAGYAVVSCSTTAGSGYMFYINYGGLQGTNQQYFNQMDAVVSITDVSNIFCRIGLMSNPATDEIRTAWNFKITSGGTIVSQTYNTALVSNSFTGLPNLTSNTIYHFRIKTTISSVTFEIYTSSGILVASNTHSTQIPPGVGSSANMLGIYISDSAGGSVKEIGRIYHDSLMMNPFNYGSTN